MPLYVNINTLTAAQHERAHRSLFRHSWRHRSSQKQFQFQHSSRSIEHPHKQSRRSLQIGDFSNNAETTGALLTENAYGGNKTRSINWKFEWGAGHTAVMRSRKARFPNQIVSPLKSRAGWSVCLHAAAGRLISGTLSATDENVNCAMRCGGRFSPVQDTGVNNWNANSNATAGKSLCTFLEYIFFDLPMTFKLTLAKSMATILSISYNYKNRLYLGAYKPTI